MNVRWTPLPRRCSPVRPAYDSRMSGVAALLLGLLIGLVVGVAAGRRFASSRARDGQRLAAASQPATTADEPGFALAPLREAVLERAPIAVLTLDSSDDVLLANRRARELKLLDRRGAGEPLLEIARSARQHGETSRQIVIPAAGLSRRALHLRVGAVPLPERVVALLIEDVTEAHRVDVVRRDFVANVSHEIKTPVGALGLLAEAAVESLNGIEDADEARHFVERISRESARLGRLVSELLDLSRLQGAEAPPAFVPVRLDDVVAEAADRAALPADAKNITIVQGEPSGAVVAGVEAQLVTAVSNLLDNAINYSPDGTRVAVTVRRSGDVWAITVTDQGVGIPEADLDRIFERFYRVDPARSRATGGTGLGLAIVKHIVRNHDGNVRVWSSPGAGSSFTLVLPAADSADRISEVPDAPASAPDRREEAPRAMTAAGPSASVP